MKNRDQLVEALESNLNTMDKRYMFLRMEFKELLPMINIEGSPHETAWHIVLEFEKRGMLGSLMATLNAKLDCEMILEIDMHQQKF